MRIDKIEVPESLKEITISQYKRFATFEGTEDEMAYKMIQVFTDVRNPLDLPVKTTGKIINHLSDLLSKHPQLERTFTYNEKEYGFIPNLEQISMGEFIDLDSNLGDWNKIERLMSILYRPVTKSGAGLYDIEPYKGTHGDFKDLPIHYVIGAQVFFWTIVSELVNLSLSFLENPTIKKELESTLSELNTGRNTDGLRQSILSLKTTLQNGIPSLKDPQMYVS